jgi:uncharacterized protein GlcG (DUF336 family)
MKLLKSSAGALALGLGSVTAAFGDAPVAVSVKILASHVANDIAVAAVNECSKRGFKVASAVVGRDGHLQAYLRDPLAGPHTILVSQRKAYSAATLQAPTSQMAARQDLNYAPGILLIVGGVPINVGGVFYGGVAVAGADPEVDEQCAQAGIDAVAEALEFAQ